MRPRGDIRSGVSQPIPRKPLATMMPPAMTLEAEQLRIWKEFGMVSLIDYLERVLGYAPRTGQRRLRVARALEHLPELTDALTQGELSFSAVKELVRVATPATGSAWRDAARGKNIRQLEELCAGDATGRDGRTRGLVERAARVGNGWRTFGASGVPTRLHRVPSLRSRHARGRRRECSRHSGSVGASAMLCATRRR